MTRKDVKRDTVIARRPHGMSRRLGRAMPMPILRLTLLLQLSTAVISAGAAASARSASQPAIESELAARLQRLGEQVEQYYRQAQRILATETVHIQPVGSDLSADGFGRRLIYELRTEWDETVPGATPDPKALRRLLLVDGRAPKPKDEPKCMDPNAVSDDPLTMLLPSKRDEFLFALAADARLDGRPVKTMEFRSRRTSGYKPPVATWKDDCVSIPLDGFVRGRIRIDAESGDVLRLEQFLTGPVDVNPPLKGAIDTTSWRVLERWDQVIRYKPVVFRGPDETLMVPMSIETLSILRGGGSSRVRTTQTYSGYRRFVAESRIVK
jgi:hypothetical protein